MEDSPDISHEVLESGRKCVYKGHWHAAGGRAVMLNHVESSKLQQTTTSNRCKTNHRLFGQDDPYVRFLLNRRDRSFYMKPWSGNSGDALIWLGTEHLLRDLKIVRTLDPRKADVILIPGGNQTMWQGNIDVWKEVWTRWPDKEFVVGPTTARLGYTTWRRDVEQLGRNVTGIFARDIESHTTLCECGLSSRIETGLSHDAALYLWESDLLGAHREAATQEFVLAAFRRDHEAVVHVGTRRTRWESLLPFFLCRRIRRRRVDAHREDRIALVTQHTQRAEPMRVCDASRDIFERFLEIVRSASEVHTDRLHCMLLAVMLGKPTFAYQTAYGKLEAIYEHSIKDRAHVEVVRDAPVPPDRTGRPPLASAPAART
jgi:exopolysaccharide biosynthesis predicted pyruvyltransferase EpsI